MRIRTAYDSEAPELSKLAFRSKAHWNYPEEWMKAWYLQGVFVTTAKLCRKGGVRLAEDESRRILGFYSLKHRGHEALLDDLWVEPSVIGSGQRVGEALLQHAIEDARELRQEGLMLYADPNAVGFYEKYGLNVVGYSMRDAMTQRSLPMMWLELNS
jgi:ribosomal protein S18 acetylase RimI-like enzyme